MGLNMKLIKDLNDLEYMPMKIRVDISIITLFILIKTYFMVLIIGLLFIIKMDLAIIDPKTITSLVSLLLNLCSIELVVIILDLLYPFIYNLYVKIRRFKAK